MVSRLFSKELSEYRKPTTSSPFRWRVFKGGDVVRSYRVKVPFNLW